jgi:hypothetical protein
LRVSTDAEIDLAFKTVAQQRIGAVMVTAGPFFDTRREKLVTLASHYAVPAMYHFREFAAARQWLHEIKLDGFRIIAGKKGHSLRSTAVPALTSPTAFR